MNDRPTPETKWYVTEYPEECSFAITDGNEILVTIIGGNTIGDQCDLASRIAKLPDLERERDEARAELANLESLMFGGLVQPAPKNALAWRVFDAVMAIKKERDGARQEWGKASMDAAQLLSEKTKVIAERDQLKEALLIMKNLLKPGIELFPEIREILKQGGVK